MTDPRRRDALIIAGLVLATCGVFGQVAGFEFLEYDDDRFLTDNPALAGGLTGGSVVWSFTTNHASLWIPLTWLSHLVDVELFGVRAGPHHLTNLFQHVLTTGLLFLVLRGMTGATWRSALVAALFAWHPAHVESVAWVTERKDTLSTFFLVAALGAHHRWTLQPTRGRRAALLALAVLGLLTKPMLVTLPVLLLLVDFWPLARSGPRRLVGEKWPLIAASLAVGVVTFVVGQRGGIVASLAEVGFVPRLVNALIGYALYPLQLVWPVGLYAQVPFRHAAPAWQIVLALGFVGAMCWASVRYRRRAPWLAWGWWWYVITLVPVSGLAQQGIHGTADRYTYVPYIGLFVIVAWGGEALARRWRATRVAAGVVTACLVVLGVLAHAQTGTWRDSLTLFGHALDRNPDNPMAHVFLGRGLEARDRVPEAAASYREALRLDPLQHVAHLELGRLLAAAGEPAAAVRHYEAALAAFGDAADLRRDLGIQHLLLGDHAAAAGHLERALDIDPSHAGARTNLALARLALGEFAAAQGLLEEVMAAAPDDPRVRYNLACVASRRGDATAAAARLREAFARGFTNREAVAADPDLAHLRASPEYEEFRTPRAPSGR